MVRHQLYNTSSLTNSYRFPPKCHINYLMLMILFTVYLTWTTWLHTQHIFRCDTSNNMKKMLFYADQIISADINFNLTSVIHKSEIQLWRFFFFLMPSVTNIKKCPAFFKKHINLTEQTKWYVTPTRWHTFIQIKLICLELHHFTSSYKLFSRFMLS